MISEHSALSTPLPFGLRTWLWRYTYFLLLISMLRHGQSIFQIERGQVVFLCWIQDLNQVLLNRISSRLNARWQTDWAIEDQAKTWTQQPVPMISEHSAHSTPLPFGFRAWLWPWISCSIRVDAITHTSPKFNGGLIINLSWYVQVKGPMVYMKHQGPLLLTWCNFNPRTDK